MVSDSPGNDQGFVELWPTTFVRRRLDGFEQPTRALIELVRGLERQHRDLTTDYRAPDLFNRDDPPVDWLRTQVNHTVVGYFAHIGMDYPIEWTIQGWSSINRFGDYHDAHNHPRAYLSGTYYAQVPKRREPLTTRGDLRPGCITFYDPRAGVNMTAIKGDPYVDPEYTVAPEPGLLLLWPAFINHFVHPNLSKQARISISFNIMLKWTDDYLPDQG